jgi:hypothetical protein
LVIPFLLSLISKEILTSDEPYPGLNGVATAIAVTGGLRPTLSDYWPEGLRGFLGKNAVDYHRTPDSMLE